jgi:hypothetical protein
MNKFLLLTIIMTFITIIVILYLLYDYFSIDKELLLAIRNL